MKKFSHCLFEAMSVKTHWKESTERFVTEGGSANEKRKMRNLEENHEILK